MSAITTHVLDAVLGKPAVGIAVRLDKKDGEGWSAVSSGATNADGRCHDLAPTATNGTYRLTFSILDYMTQRGRTTIYPEISITFICSGNEHYHLPLLLSDNSYTTYRGS
jgi:5-hydroxyisourate hydrolase